MATSDGLGRQVLGYLESARNLVGCGAGAVGLGLHFAGLGGSWWPGVVAGLYGAGALLTPGRGPEPGPGPTPTSAPVPASAPTPLPRPKPVPVPSPDTDPDPDPELDALAGFLGSVPLPAAAGVAELVAALRAAEPGPAVRLIVRHRLPVAVDGYLRARAWGPWAGPDAPDPESELRAAVAVLTADLP
ncbi:hypothetical protein ACPC54_01710 [Kitasatospora sp. NPDC094028]